MESLLCSHATELAAAAHHLASVIYEDSEKLPKAQGAGLAIDERDGVDGESVLERGELVELLEHGLGID